jgi:hypothetical protein
MNFFLVHNHITVMSSADKREDEEMLSIQWAKQEVAGATQPTGYASTLPS